MSRISLFDIVRELPEVAKRYVDYAHEKPLRLVVNAVVEECAREIDAILIKYQIDHPEQTPSQLGFVNGLGVSVGTIRSLIEPLPQREDF